MNCGEVALVVEKEKDTMKIVSYTIPRWGEIFEKGEIRNTFLSQSMENKCFEDPDWELLSKYLDRCVISKRDEEQMTRSVYKYKPVALKTKPVIGELPAEFRILREIIGDPLIDIPKLLVNPPDFVPTGRYTQERKEMMDD